MKVSTESVLLTLAAGGLIAVLAVVSRFFSSVCRRKPVLMFLQDTTFVFIACMITFLVSFPISSGRIRLLQLLLEAVSFFAVWLILSPAADYLAGRCISLISFLGKFLRKLMGKDRIRAKNRGKNSKNPKKRLDISPHSKL